MTTSKHYADALPAGTKLLWFDIEKVLGKGGFGITYLGNDTNNNQRVAIKEYLPVAFSSRNNDLEIRPNSPADAKLFEWGLDRFIKEAQILAQFRHPCIVQVFSFFRSNNTAYMVMEYVEGEDLDALLRRCKTLDEATLQKIVPMLLDGLETLHKSEYIHRDIKPPNILIRESNGMPVILDFGSARQSVTSQGDQMTSLLSVGYSPFEQYDSTGDRQGPWSDIYAMGGVLYRAVTGQKPVEATVRINARMYNAPDPLPSAVELGKGRYSQSFLQAVDKALMVLGNDRPQTVVEWRHLLLGELVAMGQTGNIPANTAVVPETGSSAGRTKNSWRSFVASVNPFSGTDNADPKKILSAALPGVLAPIAGQVRHLAPVVSPVATTTTVGVSPGGNRPTEITQLRRLVSREESPRRIKELQTGPRITSGETVAIREAGTVWEEPITKMEFVWVPGGTYMLGAPDSAESREDDEKPEHEVRLDGFWIGKYPVTWGKWRRIMGDYPPGLFMNSKVNYPVERITWLDVHKFLDKLATMINSRHTFRLPTEAEWECAARAGARVLSAPELSSQAWAELIQDYAWFKGNSRGQAQSGGEKKGDSWGVYDMSRCQTQPIGSKKPNNWGLHDMLGNVWEWVGDRYQADYYGRCPRNNPCGPDGDAVGPKISGVLRVARGGSWGSPPQECWPTSRHRFVEKSANFMLGFRLVRVD